MYKFPAYFKIAHVLLILILFFYILSLGREILVPLTFALIMAILLNPVAKFFHRKGVGRVLSITISVVLLMLLVAGVLFFIITQVSRFQESLPELKTKTLALSEAVM